MSSSTETNRSFYDRISATYDLIADAGEHRAREAGEAALNVQPGERVLEPEAEPVAQGGAGAACL